MGNLSECPKEGCTYDSETRTGVRRHYGIQHEGSIAGDLAECDYCEKEFRREPNLLKKSERTFCSKKCRNNWQSDEHVGENHHQYNSVEVQCSWCGDTKRVKKSKLSQENHFCDYDCYWSWKSENKKGENANAYRGGPETIECAWCGSKKKIDRSSVNEDGNNFCDRKCEGKWLSENTSGSDSWNWEGGPEEWAERNYGDNWNLKRKKILERDSYRCQSCGIAKSEVRDRGAFLHVHHIVRIREFDSVEEANKESNLITVCPYCHKSIEDKPLDPDIFPYYFNK